jgi:hypothetical protein
MSEKVDVAVEVSGWTKEQTAFMLFDKLRFLEPTPTNSVEALRLYATCLSVIRYGADAETGRILER